MTGGNTDAVEPLAALTVVDGGSFEAFYRCESRPLLRLAWSLTGRRDLAEEAVQDVMVKVHERWSTVSAYDRPGAFARRVLLNDLASAARRQEVERRANARVHQSELHIDAEPPDARVWAALRSLPERQAQTVALHYLEDLSVAEIAETLGIAEGTVKVHLHRGRLALADRLRSQLSEGAR